jgi:hypothetical protein
MWHRRVVVRNQGYVELTGGNINLTRDDYCIYCIIDISAAEISGRTKWGPEVTDSQTTQQILIHSIM